MKRRLILSLGVLAGIIVAWQVAARPVESSFVWVGSFAMMAVGCMLLQRSNEALSINTVSIQGIFILSYLVYIVIPGFFVYDESTGSAKGAFLFAALSVLITVPFGGLLVNGFLRANRKEVVDFCAAELVDTSGGRYRIAVFVLILGIGVGVTGMYAAAVETLPIFYLLKNPGSFALLPELRQAAGVDLGSKLLYPHYYYQMIIYPVLTILALGEYMVAKQRVWFWLFIAALCMGVLHSSLTAAKSPVAQMTVVILVFYYMAQRGRIKPRHVVMGIAAVLAFPIIVTGMAYWGAGGGAAGVITSLAKRIFYEPSWLIAECFEVFPNLIAPLHGRSIGRVAWALGQEEFNVPNYMANYMHPDSPIRSGNANAGFIANLNADFGLWGVIFGGIFSGIVMQVLQILEVRRKKTVAVVAVVSFQMVIFTLLSHTALSAVLFSYGPILVIVLVSGMRAAEHMLRYASSARWRMASTSASLIGAGVNHG